jgi:hypothetical protein
MAATDRLHHPSSSASQSLLKPLQAFDRDIGRHHFEAVFQQQLGILSVTDPNLPNAPATLQPRG